MMAGKRLVAVAVSFVGLLILVTPTAALAQSVDPWVGTWKVNTAKSTFSPGPGSQVSTVKVELAAGGGQKHVHDGVNAKGQTFHMEYTFKFDGIPVKPVALASPATTAATYAFKKVDERSYDIFTTIDGKPTTTSRLTIASDGKTITQTITGANPQGQAVNSALVWERQ